MSTKRMTWQSEDVQKMLSALGGQQSVVDEIGAMSSSFMELGYSPKIFMAVYGIDPKAIVTWDGFKLNGRPITSKQFAYLRAHNINPNGLDCAQASQILDYLYMNGGTTRRLMATKWCKELMDLLPKDRIPTYKNTEVYDIKFVKKQAATEVAAR